MSGLKLYEATEALLDVYAWLDEHDDIIRQNEGALPDELAELLSKAEGDFKVKVQRVALYVRECAHFAAIAKAERDQYDQRMKRFEIRADRLKKFYLKSQLIEAKMPRVECELLTVRIQKNGAPSVIHELTPEALWEEKYPFAKQTESVQWFHDRSRIGDTVSAYSVNDAELVAEWKAGNVPPEFLEHFGISITVGSHIRID